MLQMTEWDTLCIPRYNFPTLLAKFNHLGWDNDSAVRTVSRKPEDVHHEDREAVAQQYCPWDQGQTYCVLSPGLLLRLSDRAQKGVVFCSLPFRHLLNSGPWSWAMGQSSRSSTQKGRSSSGLILNFDDYFPLHAKHWPVFRDDVPCGLF